MMRRSRDIAWAAVALLAVFASTAHAQQPAPPTGGPLVVEKIQSGWVFSPDMRATDLDGKAGALAGGYIGRITDRRLVFGAGGYFLTNRDDDFKLAYGGPVVEYLIRPDRRIGFGVRALVGAGSGTLPLPLAELIDPRVLQALAAGPRIRDRRGPSGTALSIVPDATIAVRDDFFVVEPQANVTWNISQGQRLVFGLGYRVVGSAPVLGDELSGLSGSIAFQVGGK